MKKITWMLVVLLGMLIAHPAMALTCERGTWLTPAEQERFTSVTSPGFRDNVDCLWGVHISNPLELRLRMESGPLSRPPVYNGTFKRLSPMYLAVTRSMIRMIGKVGEELDKDSTPNGQWLIVTSDSMTDTGMKAFLEEINSKRAENQKYRGILIVHGVQN